MLVDIGYVRTQISVKRLDSSVSLSNFIKLDASQSSKRPFLMIIRMRNLGRGAKEDIMESTCCSVREEPASPSKQVPSEERLRNKLQ